MADRFGGWPAVGGVIGELSAIDIDSGATRSGRSFAFATAGLFGLNVVVQNGDYALASCYVWGAGGGGYSGAGGSRKGGGGGFGKATVKLYSGLYVVCVGSGGIAKGDSAGVATIGFGGGGQNGNSGFGGSGGGLTGLFRYGPPFVGLPVIIAGGGGGAGYSSNGGAGGGTTGANSADGNATGGGQYAAGSPPSYGISGATRGGAYQGWSSLGNTDGGGGGGGGGGMFGGGSGANNTSDGGGAGGSGYADSRDTINAILAQGSGDTAAGGSEPFYPGSGTVGTGGAAGADGKRGHLILTW